MKKVKQKVKFIPTEYDKCMRDIHRKTGNKMRVEIPSSEEMDYPLSYYKEMEKYWNS